VGKIRDRRNGRRNLQKLFPIAIFATEVCDRELGQSGAERRTMP